MKFILRLDNDWTDESFGFARQMYHQIKSCNKDKILIACVCLIM